MSTMIIVMKCVKHQETELVIWCLQNGTLCYPNTSWIAL